MKPGVVSSDSMFPNIVPSVWYLAYGNRERMDGGLKEKKEVWSEEEAERKKKDVKKQLIGKGLGESKAKCWRKK